MHFITVSITFALACLHTSVKGYTPPQESSKKAHPAPSRASRDRVEVNTSVDHFTAEDLKNITPYYLVKRVFGFPVDFTDPSALQLEKENMQKKSEMLHAAVKENNVQDVKSLIASGTDWATPNSDCQTPYQVACTKGSKVIEECLLRVQFFANAVKRGAVLQAYHYLHSGVDINTCVEGQDPLKYASQLKDSEIWDMLLQTNLVFSVLPSLASTSQR